MKNYEQIGGCVLLGFSILFLGKSLEYPLGNWLMPGAAVFPILASSILMVIAGAILLSRFLKPKSDPPGSVSAPQLRKAFEQPGRLRE